MKTVTFDTPEMAQFVAEIFHPYGVQQPRTTGATLTIDDDAIEILADIDDQTDGHYDGRYIYISGTEYEVTRIGRQPIGPRTTIRLDAETYALLDAAADRHKVDRSSIIREAIDAWLDAHTITLISACVGDRVPGVELAECDGEPWIAAIDRPEVQEWMAAQGYGDDPDELIYAVTGDEDIPAGYLILTVAI